MREGPLLGFSGANRVEVGEKGLTVDEQWSYFAMWAVMKTPLLLGNGIRKLEREDLMFRIITNPHLIGINQDSFGKQAECRVGCD